MANKAVVIGIGALVAGAALLLMGGKANAAEAPPVPVPQPNDPQIPGLPPHWKDAGKVKEIAQWLALAISAGQWRAFQPIDPSIQAQTEAQRDATEALVFFQSQVGLTADAILGPGTSGALVYFVPDLEPVLRAMGAYQIPGRTLSEVNAIASLGAQKAQAAEAADR